MVIIPADISVAVYLVTGFYNNNGTFAESSEGWRSVSVCVHPVG